MCLFQLRQVTKVCSVLRQANDDTLYMHVHQHFQTVHLIIESIVRIRDDTHIPSLTCLSLDAFHNVGILVIRDVRHHNTYGSRSVITQAQRKGIWTIARIFSQLLNLLLQFRTDTI